MEKATTRFSVDRIIVMACVWTFSLVTVVWIGWAVNAPLLKGSFNGTVAVNPVTALAFLFLAGALWLRRNPVEEEGGGNGRLYLGRALAAVALLLASGRLGDYLLGWQLGWDQLLFSSRLDAEDLYPNRMEPNTAICIILLGGVLIMTDVRTRFANHLVPMIALFIAITAWVAILGYAYSAEFLYGFGEYIPMAFPTAVTFLFLSLGCLFARPQLKLMQVMSGGGPGSVMARRLLGVIIVVPPLLCGLRILAEKAGFLGIGTGAALMATINMLILGLVIWRSALDLNRADEERNHAEEKLRRSREEAETASKTKSQFLANMSHELRTPLNSIIGFSEILADETFGELNARQQRYIDNVLGSGRHLLSLINDILDLSKIEAGGSKLERVFIEVEGTLEGVETMLSGLAAKKRIAYATTVAPEIPPLFADPARFKQIMYNLVSNAIKFTVEGGNVEVQAKVWESSAEANGELPAVSPRLASSLGAGRFLLVSVVDSGIGIHPRDQDRLFKEFEQIDSTYARQQEGTGLGLALTRRLVEMHGGAIWLESEGIPGRGSTFHFVIPFRDQSVPEGLPPNRLDLPLVLVIEDDRHANGLLDQHLSGAGYAVAHAYNGAQGLEMAAKYEPQAITLDILLPDQSGWDVLTRLKEIPGTRDIPVVIISITENRELGFSLGAAEYFVKPVDREQLIAAVARVGRRETRKINTILVVDDEAEVVEMLSAAMEDAGFKVLTASGGREALKKARFHLPDLITIDLVMPHVNGFEVVRKLRADPLTSDIPLLVHTGKSLTREEKRELEVQVQAVTQKNGIRQFMEELEGLTGRPTFRRDKETV